MVEENKVEAEKRLAVVERADSLLKVLDMAVEQVDQAEKNLKQAVFEARQALTVVVLLKYKLSKLDKAIKKN